MLLNTIPNSATDLAGKAFSDVFKNAYQTYRLTNSILILVFIIAVCLACILFYLYFKKKSSNAITADILQEDIETINNRLTEQKPVTMTSDNGSIEPHTVVMTSEQYGITAS